MGVKLESVSKSFGDVAAVDSVSLDILEGEFFSLLGPSGCGKTTLLRLVAGFETPDRGRIHIDGRDVTDVPARRRPTAMVFQSYALFPHMTVGQNIAYGLRIRKMNASEREQRVSEMLDRVQLSGYENRPVTKLSGGQQQRVALARALAVQPRVLLFDEPLSNLDAALREETRAELKQLQQELGTTSLYVTHDQEEALSLSDRMAVMRSGGIVENGTPNTLYANPRSAFVAAFLGGANLVRDHMLAEKLSGRRMPAGKCLAIKPDQLVPVRSGERGVAVRIVSRQYLGRHVEWWLAAEDTSLRMWTEPGMDMPDPLAVGLTYVHWVDSEE
jgi:ABC-type Fe3+/spermidine/putrescine transport system ATPase subunit